MKKPFFIIEQILKTEIAQLCPRRWPFIVHAVRVRISSLPTLTFEFQRNFQQILKFSREREREKKEERVPKIHHLPSSRLTQVTLSLTH